MLKIKNNTLICDCGAAIEQDDIMDTEGSITDEFVKESCYGHCIGCGKDYEYSLTLKFKFEQAIVKQNGQDEDAEDDEDE